MCGIGLGPAEPGVFQMLSLNVLPYRWRHIEIFADQRLFSKSFQDADSKCAMGLGLNGFFQREAETGTLVAPPVRSVFEVFAKQKTCF